MSSPTFAKPAAGIAAPHQPQADRRSASRVRLRSLLHLAAITLALAVASLLGSLAAALVDQVRAGNGDVPATQDAPLPVTPPGMPPFDFEYWR